MSRLVARSGWQPRARLGPALPRVPDEVWLHHTVTRATNDPIADVRTVERIGIGRFGRMSYSYLYHPPSRTWYEGAGQSVGAHTGGRNSRALGLSIIGNTENDPMPNLVADAAWLIRHLIATGRLAPVARSNNGPGPWGQGYPTGGHRDQKQTACPGRNAYALIGQIRAAVTGANPPAKPAPAKPATTGALAMSDITEITNAIKATNDKLDKVLAAVGAGAKKATAIREAPGSGKVWIVGTEGRWHVPNMDTLNLLVWIGSVAPGISALPAAKLAGIPVIAAPTGKD